MPMTCEIVLDEYVFYSGKILSGTANLSTTDEKIVHGVKIHIAGGSSVVPRYSNQPYILEQDLLDRELYVVGSSDGNIRLTPGVYSYKFQFILPPELPSTVPILRSFVDATTSYKVHVVVDMPFSIEKKFSVSTPFTVIQPRYLNLDGTLLLPLAVEKSKRFAYNCLLFWNTSDPLEIVARIPVRGYYPGETIHLELDVKNRSHKHVTKFTVKLKKRITCFYNKKRTDPHHVDTIISKHESRGCNCNQDAKIQVNVRVPLTLPTNNFRTYIIQIRHSIEIIGHVASEHCNPSLSMPIEIGRLPDAFTSSEEITLGSLLEPDDWVALAY